MMFMIITYTDIMFHQGMFDKITPPFKHFVKKLA